VNELLVTRGAQSVAVRRRPSVLPNDGSVNWLAGRAIPNNDRFALISDADSGDLGWFQPSLLERLHRDITLAAPDFLRIVFHPSGVWEVLLELALANGDTFAFFAEEDGA
jgi:hypothetical protein